MKQWLKLKTLLLLAILPLAFSCDDDDKLPKSPNGKETGDEVNLNKNPGTNEDYARLEFPRLRGDANSIVLVRRVPTYGINYAIEYDTQKRSQRWTCWQWYRGNCGSPWNRNNWINETDNEWVRLNMQTYGFSDPFQPDPDLAPGVRTELDEYKVSGYQRGHICASADRLISKEANEQTFYLSNIMPQSSGLNSGIWLDMENKVQNWGKDNDFRRVLYVVKGGTIDKEEQIRAYTPTGMVVPKYFFMAVLCEDNNGDFKAMAFWVEHTNQNKKGDALSNYVINVRQLEERTGIDFFCNLPDDTEQLVETATTREIINAWKL